jgi:hypothetical protein
MEKIKLTFALTLLSFSVNGSSEPLPKLQDTDLFKKIAANCELVDLSTWTHATRNIIEKSGTELKKVMLCNSKRFPVFYINFKYDPQGQTKSFFYPFYQEMKVANGNNALAFVDIIDSTIVYLNFQGPSGIEINYEMYLSGSE